MTMQMAKRTRKMALVLAGITLAALSIGATEPIYPEVGRGDQTADISRCSTETIDGVVVCTRDDAARFTVSVTTVAAGLTVVD